MYQSKWDLICLQINFNPLAFGKCRTQIIQSIYLIHLCYLFCAVSLVDAKLTKPLKGNFVCFLKIPISRLVSKTVGYV